MRWTIFLLASSLLIAGCSKRFSYRDAYKFDRHVFAVKAVNPDLLQQVDAPHVMASLKADPGPAASLPMLSLTPPESEKSKKGSSFEMHVADASDTAINSNQRPAREPLKSRNWAAFAGVISIIIGWLLVFFVPYLILLGIIFCIIGLRSEKKKLAVAGLCLNIVAVLIALIAFSMGGGIA